MTEECLTFTAGNSFGQERKKKNKDKKTDRAFCFYPRGSELPVVEPSSCFRTAQATFTHAQVFGSGSTSLRQTPGGEGGAFPFMALSGTCGQIGYGFQGFSSYTGYQFHPLLSFSGYPHI